MDEPRGPELAWLPARLIFQDRVERAIAWADRHGGRAAVVLLQVTPRSSGRRGESGEILADVAGRLTEALRAVDSVSRLEEGRFAVLLPEVDSAAGAALVGAKLVESAVAGSEGEPDADAIAGVVVYPDHALTLDALVRNAELALGRAQDRGAGAHVVFEGEPPADTPP